MSVRPVGVFALVSLRRIWDERTRSGIDLTAKFLQHGSVDDKTLLEIRRRQERNRSLRLAIKMRRKEGESYAQLQVQERRYKEELSEAVDRYLIAVQTRLNEGVAPLYVEKGPMVGSPKQKQSFVLRSETYDLTVFISRIANAELRASFSLYSRSRHEITSALAQTLRGKWDKGIVRTDVKSFYESVNHKILFDFIDRNRALSPVVRIWLRQMLDSYSSLAGVTPGRGLPRGIGMSAALSEIYLQKFDQAIISDEACVFYGRYVDDIVVVYATASESGHSGEPYLEKLKLALRHLDLEQSEKKSTESFRDSKFSYLGYEFKIGPLNNEQKIPGLTIDLSHERERKLRKRVDRSFEQFRSGIPVSAIQLERRIRLLTRNQKLFGAKSRVFSGLRSTNPLLTAYKRIGALDRHLAHAIGKIRGSDPNLALRLEKLTFESGYRHSLTTQFSTGELSSLTLAWRKHGE